MSTISQYKGYTVPTNLGDANLWGAMLNTTLGLIDANLGGNVTLYSSNGDVTLSSTQAANLLLVLSGTLTADYTVTVTSSLGGYGQFVVDNQCTGAFNTVLTQSSSLTAALTIPQGGRTYVVGDGTSFYRGNDTQTANLYSYLGSPQGNVAGNAATSNGGATSVVRDVTNQIDYACKTTGSSSTAIWVPQAGLPAIGGMLTVSTDSNNPVPTSDVTGTASVFWTPYTSNWMWASDGTAIFPVQFSRMTLTLTNTNNAASQIQDVFYYWNGGSPVIGTGPTWAAGGGSVSAGSCARGTGAGSTQLSRVAGVWTNTVAMTINNGASNYAVSAGHGIYLGSIFIDTSAGQVTCHRSYGQSRKWGIFNAFATSRVPIRLKAGDSTASWNYNSTTIRASNGSASNSLTFFSGLAEEQMETTFTQSAVTSIAAAGSASVYVGWNSTTTASGKAGYMFGNVNTGNVRNDMLAKYVAPPALGIQTATSLESTPTAGGATNQTFYGTEASMLLIGEWRA